MTAQLDDVIIREPKISKTSSVSVATLKNVKDTVLYYLQKDIKYVTPTDRHIEIQVEGLVNKNSLILVVALTPRWRNLSEKKSNVLKRDLVITATITLNDIETRLSKMIQWALNYFALQIMYRQDVKQITIRVNKDSYKIEETH